MRTNPTSNRAGFALPVALLAIMVIGALVTGGFYASSQEGRIATSSDLGNRAFYAAEYGLEEAMGTWKNANITMQFEVPDSLWQWEVEYDRMPVRTGGVRADSYRVSVRFLSPSMFLMKSRGTIYAGRDSATRVVGTIVRTAEPVMPAPTALAIYGGLTVGGNSEIRGNDSGGPGCAAGDTVAGVTAYDSSLVEEGNRDRITGNPPVEENETLDTTALSDFGDVDLGDLIASATKTYAAGESENGMAPVTTLDSLGNPVCDMSVRSNWGDPSGIGPCADEFPIIHAEGDLHLKTGSGQGILIVEGNLKASGNFDFYGVVIVLGELETTGTGNHLEGSVIVQGHGLLDSETTTLGNSLVQYSECRTRRAFNASLRPRPLASRSWLDFTAITRGEADDN